MTSEHRATAKRLLENACVEFAANARAFNAAGVERPGHDSAAAEVQVVQPSAPTSTAVHATTAVGFVAQNHVSDDCVNVDDGANLAVDHGQISRDELKRAYLKCRANKNQVSRRYIPN